MTGTLALIAGRGQLPDALVAARPEAPIICSVRGSAPDSLKPDIEFSIENLGGLFRRLKQQGVDRVCFCGAVDRPEIDWRRFDFASLALIPKMVKALRKGDDGALRIAMNLFEQQGFQVVGAHEVAPNLLLKQAVYGTLSSDADHLAQIGDQISVEQGQADLGQACVIRADSVIARESHDGTDAMLARLPRASGATGLLYKAPKPNQDLRVDMPTIGPNTVRGAARAGLAGIVITAGEVLVLDQAAVFSELQETGLFLWSRERQL